MSDATELAGAASSTDPATGLTAVASLRTLLDSLEELQVESARRQGWSWQQIARALGVSKQAVHKKYGGGSRLRRARG
jgi:DNA-binding NarL/FixJ family response regulator